MTVTYTAEVTSSKGFSCFLKLLRRWRGSIYKLVWKELLIYLVVFYLINTAYRLVDASEDDAAKEYSGYFKQVVKYCEKYYNLIPISFILGFYVNIVFTRWWDQFTTIPYPDNLAILVSASIIDETDRGRIIRRTIMRYVCLAFVISLRLISPRVKKRFPTFNHLVEAGLLEADEKNLIMELDEEFPNFTKQWLPISWASNVVTRARQEGLIRDDFSVKAILTELCNYRGKCGTLLDYDWISIPLVYTQVVTLAVYAYFLTTIIAYQTTDIIYFPVLAVLEFFFYMGWLKVAEVLINPFGDDDDDFDVTWMVDRNLQVPYLIVDKMHHEHPKLIRDRHWADVSPQTLPHTKASGAFPQDAPVHSTANITIKKKEAEIIDPNASCENIDGGIRNRRMRNVFRIDKRTNDMAELNEIRTGGAFDKPRSTAKGCVRDSNAEEVDSICAGANCDNSAFEELKETRQQAQRERLKKIVAVWQSKQ